MYLQKYLKDIGVYKNLNNSISDGYIIVYTPKAKKYIDFNMVNDNTYFMSFSPSEMSTQNFRRHIIISTIEDELLMQNKPSNSYYIVCDKSKVVTNKKFIKKGRPNGNKSHIAKRGRSISINNIRFGHDVRNVISIINAISRNFSHEPDEPIAHIFAYMNESDRINIIETKDPRSLEDEVNMLLKKITSDEYQYDYITDDFSIRSIIHKDFIKSYKAYYGFIDALIYMKNTIEIDSSFLNDIYRNYRKNESILKRNHFKDKSNDMISHSLVSYVSQFDNELTLKNHQKYALSRLANSKVAVLNMDVGLGKTRTSIAYSEMRNFKKVLYVTEPSYIKEVHNEFKSIKYDKDVTIIKTINDISKYLSKPTKYAITSYNFIKKVIEEYDVSNVPAFYIREQEILRELRDKYESTPSEYSTSGNLYRQPKYAMNMAIDIIKTLAHLFDDDEIYSRSTILDTLENTFRNYDLNNIIRKVFDIMMKYRKSKSKGKLDLELDSSIVRDYMFDIDFELYNQTTAGITYFSDLPPEVAKYVSELNATMFKDTELSSRNLSYEIEIMSDFRRPITRMISHVNDHARAALFIINRLISILNDITDNSYSRSNQMNVYYSKQISNLLNNKFSLVIYDECQKIKNYKSVLWTAAIKLNSKNTLLMSATPIGNNPNEILSHYIQGYGLDNPIVGVETKRYIIPSNNKIISKTINVNPYASDYDTNSNICYIKPKSLTIIPTLNSRITDISKLKQDKIKDLRRRLSNSHLVNINRSMGDIVVDQAWNFDIKYLSHVVKPTPQHMDLYSTAIDAIEYNSNITPTEILSMLNTLIRISEHPKSMNSSFTFLTNKQKKVIDIAIRDIEHGNSCIIFATLHEVIDLLYDNIKSRLGTNVFKMSKGMSPDQKYNLVQKYRDCNEPAVILGHPSSLGRAFNIDKASSVILSDLPWSYIAYDQTIGRILRPKQKKKPIVHVVSNKYMIDMYKMDRIIRDANMHRRELRGDETISDKDIDKIDFREFMDTLITLAEKDGLI